MKCSADRTAEEKGGTLYSCKEFLFSNAVLELCSLLPSPPRTFGAEIRASKIDIFSCRNFNIASAYQIYLELVRYSLVFFSCVNLFTLLPVSACEQTLCEYYVA